MGRYAYGDIEHKFWFGTQDSNAASQFGGESSSILYYYGGLDEFDTKHLEALIQEANQNLNANLTLESNPEIIDDLSNTINNKKLELLLADIQLGLKIRNCIIENGYCEFYAEC